MAAVTFTCFPKLPLEIRRNIREHAIHEYFHKFSPWDHTSGQYLSPYNRQHDSLSRLATISTEWRDDVEKYTFKILCLQLRDAPFQEVNAFAEIMDNNPARLHHLDSLEICFDFPIFEKQQLQAMMEQQPLLQQFVDLLRDEGRARSFSELMAVLHRLEGQNSGVKPYNFRISTEHVNWRYDVWTISTSVTAWQSYTLKTYLIDLMEETPTVDAVDGMTIDPAFLNPMLMSQLLILFPKLEHIGITCHFDNDASPWVWERYLTLFRVELPAYVPNICSARFIIEEPSFTYSVYDDNNLLLPAEPPPRAITTAFRRYTGTLSCLTIDDLTTSTDFCTEFLTIPRRAAAPTTGFQWPKLTSLHIYMGNSLDVFSMSKCEDLFTAAGKAALQMPVLKSMKVYATSLHYGVTEPRVFGLRFDVEDPDYLSISVGSDAQREATLVYFGYREEEPGVAAAWDLVEKVKGLNIRKECIPVWIPDVDFERGTIDYDRSDDKKPLGGAD